VILQHVAFCEVDNLLGMSGFLNTLHFSSMSFCCVNTELRCKTFTNCKKWMFYSNIYFSIIDVLNGQIVAM